MVLLYAHVKKHNVIFLFLIENGRLESLNLAENVLWDSAEAEMVVTLNRLKSLHSLNISNCAFSLQLGTFNFQVWHTK